MFKLEENVKQLIAVQSEYAVKYNLVDTHRETTHLFIGRCDIPNEKTS